jgi:regulator of replication initiation timing
MENNENYEPKNKINTHRSHKKWLAKLDFFQDEIKYFQNRVAEVAAKNTKEEIVEKVKNFRKMIIQMLTDIDDMRHQIHLHEYYLTYFEQQHLKEGKVIKPSFEDEKIEMEKFGYTFHQLRKQLNRFLSETL